MRFAGQPEISPLTINGIQAGSRATYDRGEGWTRAECFALPEKAATAANERGVTDALSQYVEFNGLVYPEFTYKKGPLGNEAHFRAFKEVKYEYSEGKVKTTFTGHTYFGKSSMIQLYAASPSTAYPTEAITRFLGSVQWK